MFCLRHLVFWRRGWQRHIVATIFPLGISSLVRLMLFGLSEQQVCFYACGQLG